MIPYKKYKEIKRVRNFSAANYGYLERGYEKFSITGNGYDTMIS